MVRFWSHRFRRLMPGAFLALAVIAVLGATIGDHSQVVRLWGDGLAALFYVSNWRFIYLGTDYADMFASPSLVQHFWSLSIEEQFYLTFPLLAIALLRFGNRRIFVLVLAVLSLAATVWMALLFEPDVPTSRLYYGTDTRAAEILIGAILALWHAGRRPLVGMARRAAIAVGVLGLVGNLYYWFGVSMETRWLWQGGYLLYAITTAAIIVGALQPSGPARSLLSWGPLPWLGKISYGVYIYHFAFYVTLTSDWTGLDPWPLFLARVAATFVFAVPSYYLIEIPVRRGRVLTGAQPWIAMPLGVVAVVALLYVATSDPPKAEVDLSPLPEQELQIEGENGPRVMVVGDSIALGVSKGLYRWAKQTGKAHVLSFTVKGCGISRGGRLMNTRKRMTDLCDDWPRRWSTGLEKYDPAVVVVLVGGWDTTDRSFPEWGEAPRVIGDEVYDSWLESEYEAAIDLLTSRGARVLWLTAPCLTTNRGKTGVWDPARVSLLNKILSRLDAKHGAEFELLDFNAKICPGGKFTNQIDGMSQIRPDGAHLSDEASDWVGRWLGEHIHASDPSPDRANDLER